MKQTTFCIPLEVKPDSCSRLIAVIERMRAAEDSGDFGIPENFARLKRDVPTLHFMSMSVFPASEFDPTFIFEANIDGAPGVFWGQIEATLGEQLREVLRCCKRPLDEDGSLYDAVTAAQSHAPVAAYFEARTHQPSVFHHGNRGMTRDRVLREDELFAAVRSQIDRPDRIGPNPYRGIAAVGVHGKLRRELLPAFGWLNDPAETRIPAAEHIADGVRLFAFVAAVLLVLAAPGLALAAIFTSSWYLLLYMVLAIAVIALAAYLKRKPVAGVEVDTRFHPIPGLLKNAGMIAGFFIAYLAAAIVLLTPIVFASRWVLTRLRVAPALSFDAAWRSVVVASLWGLVGIVVSAGLLLLWLRYLERRDASHDAPPIDERMLREMVRREDWIAQNHMGSIVIVKPGVLRTIIIRVGHLGLGLLLRFTAMNGYLGSMRTVHFAHWAFLNNGARLLFLSNFDHSWDSYLDDFIEKASVGLTLAWGCGIGFPPTRFAILDGASHGRRFKNWALASRAVSRFWYSAYRELTVDQIERNNRIADGLRKPGLGETEAAAWIRNL